MDKPINLPKFVNYDFSQSWPTVRMAAVFLIPNIRDQQAHAH